jgi:hypothetical protein
VGPITGLRIVNLRVRDKVAYPDLTLDLAGEEGHHLVVGLENGGGKSTLLGAIYHVFVPEADQFLPRRAQRRQHKEGELKRLEHYVPGGDPTHFVVEVESPTPDGMLPGFSGPRLLLGACLWKAAGSPSSAPASEFFWSARCVTGDLSLRDLVLRGPGGRLLDYREFRAKLRQLRVETPAAQINIEEGKGAWELHLRNVGIDVEYVRQFLLRMNEDEGAADQVFTYASARAFLNSLVGVVGDPTSIDQLKGRLAEMSQDADAMVLDRQRVMLLDRLVAQTGPLAETMGILSQRVVERDEMAGHLLACQTELNRQLELAERAADVAIKRKTELDRLAIEARNAHSDANARFVSARVQVARLQAAASSAEVQKTERERDEARTNERTARAAAVLSERHTAEGRIHDIEEVLRLKTVEAEPLRRSLASALSALQQRLAADIARLESERTEIRALVARVNEDIERAGKDHAKATRVLGEFEGERRVLSSDRAALEEQLHAAVKAGLLPSIDSDVEIELGRTRARAAAEKAAAEEHEQHRVQALTVLADLSERGRRVALDAGSLKEAVRTASAELANAISRTNALANDIVQSGFLDIQPLMLDQHGESTRERLEAVIEGARLKQASVAVSAAAADRAAIWLRDTERLPPRTDVERLCEEAQGERLGARSGWAYLSSLLANVGADYAVANPGLADGIVVNVPEDFDAVVELVTASRDQINGPIVVGLAAAFETTSNEVDERSRVILPHSAHWSTVAGRELVESRTADAARWRAEYDGAIGRADAAVRLRALLAAWTAEIGPGGIEARQYALQQQQQALDKVDGERAEIDDDITRHTAHRDAAEAARNAASQRERATTQTASKLETLVPARSRLIAIGSRLERIALLETEATTARDTAHASMTEASERRQSAGERLENVATGIGELTNERSSLQGIAAVVVRPDDVVDAVDAAADRQRLAQQARDREDRWRGAISDPELRTQLTALQSAINDFERQLKQFEDVAQNARALVSDDPTRSADDHRSNAENARQSIEELGERIGERKATERQLKTELDKVQEELRGLRRPAELSPGDSTDDVHEAAVIRERLLGEREAALTLRNARDVELQLAGDRTKVMAARVELLRSALQRLIATARRLAPGGFIVPTIDMTARQLRLDTTLVLASTQRPQWLVELARASERSIDGEDLGTALDADKATVDVALNDAEDQFEALHRTLAALESGAGVALDHAEALLRNAAEEVVRGDRIIQTFRAAPRRALADLALAHHQDIVQRLTAVQHHVANFDARVGALADTVYATIADLLREVRRTVRESQLPNTPAMGRWAGAELLKLSGFETLKVEQRRVAIEATLRLWFSPDKPEARPRRFDSNEVVHELLRAVTPQFSAQILIPSDPLDPEHKPVDHLALETSGGEGVTVALILASLLASRRASARGHRRTTLLLDNPFAKVTKPEFLRLARDVADELNVQLVAFTGIRDLGALTVFPRLTQLRVSRRENANFVVPYEIHDDRLQPLLRNGTLYVSPAEWDASKRGDEPGAWPLMSTLTVARRGTEDST